jgi:hypothetical protein
MLKFTQRPGNTIPHSVWCSLAFLASSENRKVGRMMIYLHRGPDGMIRVHTDGQPVKQRHKQQAERNAEILANLREEEVRYSGDDISVLEDYERALWYFAEQPTAWRGRYYHVVICTELRAGRSHSHAYVTRTKVTREKALTACKRKHPQAKVTAIVRTSK